jgi:hypothetical protein
VRHFPWDPHGAPRRDHPDGVWYLAGHATFESEDQLPLAVVMDGNLAPVLGDVYAHTDHGAVDLGFVEIS